jgi:hypothetical protein
VDLIAANVFAAMVDVDVVNADGEPRRLLSEYRLLLAELWSLADTLGILAPSAIRSLTFCEVRRERARPGARALPAVHPARRPPLRRDAAR